MSILSGLVSSWKMDEESGTRKDSQGSNDLVTAGGAGVGVAAGKRGNAARFVEADYLRVADGAKFNPGDSSFTLAGWFYFDPADLEDRLVTKWQESAGNRHYLLRWNKAALRIQWLVRNSGDTANVNLPANSFGDPTPGGAGFHLIICGYDADADQTFIEVDNTGLDTAALVGGLLAGTSSRFTVGATSEESTAFNDSKLDGRVDELSWWSRILTDKERASLWHEGAGDFFSFPLTRGSGFIPIRRLLNAGR